MCRHNSLLLCIGIKILVVLNTTVFWNVLKFTFKFHIQLACSLALLTNFSNLILRILGISLYWLMQKSVMIEKKIWPDLQYILFLPDRDQWSVKISAWHKLTLHSLFYNNAKNNKYHVAKHNSNLLFSLAVCISRMNFYQLIYRVYKQPTETQRPICK